jgi:YHS domain-containing protein
MGRLLQLIALILLVRYVFRAVVRWLGGSEPPRVAGQPGKNKPVYRGQMVRDPVCGVFVPQERSIEDREGDEVHFFCSERCRESFRTADVPLK